MEHFFACIPAPARVASEGSATWWWLVDLLEESGCIVLPPMGIHALPRCAH